MALRVLRLAIGRLGLEGDECRMREENETIGTR